MEEQYSILQSQKAILEQDQQAKMMEYDVNIKECEKSLKKDMSLIILI